MWFKNRRAKFRKTQHPDSPNGSSLTPSSPSPTATASPPMMSTPILPPHPALSPYYPFMRVPPFTEESSPFVPRPTSLPIDYAVSSLGRDRFSYKDVPAMATIPSLASVQSLPPLPHIDTFYGGFSRESHGGFPRDTPPQYPRCCYGRDGGLVHRLSSSMVPHMYSKSQLLWKYAKLRRHDQITSCSMTLSFRNIWSHDLKSTECFNQNYIRLYWSASFCEVIFSVMTDHL